jgi:hypothetical protein
MSDEFELDEKKKKNLGPASSTIGVLASPNAQQQAAPRTMESRLFDLQRGAGNKVTTELMENVRRTSSKAKEPGSPTTGEWKTDTADFQPGFTRSPELDAIMQSLESMRVRGRVDEFSDYLSRNEILLYPVLKRYGYRGSWVKPEDTIKDFDQAHRKWIEYGEQTGPAWDLPRRPSKPDPWQKVWQLAGSDPLAALWISATVLVSESLGRMFDFSADPERMAASAQAFSTVAGIVGSARKGSANPQITPRAGAAFGPARTTQTPGPFPITLGEVKSYKQTEAGQRKLLGEYSVGLQDHAIVGLVTYDEFGNIYLRQYLAGGMQELVWEGEIGRIPPEHLPKIPFSQSAHGNAMEPLARGVAGGATGQFFDETKSPSASGPDITPRGLTRFNLLKPSNK